MGHVEKRGAGRWVAVFKDPDGRRRARSFARKLDADRFLASTTVEVLRGDWIDPTAGRVTLAAYSRRWIDERDIRPTTRALYENYWRHIVALPGHELGPLPLAELRPSTLRQWQRALGDRLAPSTSQTVRGILAAMLRSAVGDRLIAASPIDGVPRARVVRQLVRPMTLAHVLAIRDGITPRLSAAVVLGAGCGLRRGEAMGLTVDRVDWLRRVVDVDRQLVGVAAGRAVFGPPKTPASTRSVPMPGAVVDALAAHLAAFPAGPDGLIFTAPRGGPYLRGKVGAAWRDAEVRRWARETGRELGPDGFRIPADVDAAYVDAHPDGHGHRFHELRHFYASTLIADGASVKSVQARLGHASAAETLDTYSHLWPDDEDRTRATIDRLFTNRERVAGLNDDDGEAGAVPARI